MVLYTVKETIEREKLLEQNDKVLVAFSGGPDSLCLLDILLRLAPSYNLTIYAAHLNHMIRGYDAQMDAMFCYDFCEKNGVKFFLKVIDVPKLAKQTGMSMENCARQQRYSLFYDIKNELGINKIAVAHNLDDQAETVLLKLFRGSGLQGLSGMDYIRDGVIIRPLLDVYKQEIVDYCKKNFLTPRLDYTNKQAEYTRNKVRLNLIPEIEKNFTSNIKQILSRTANNIRQDYEFIDEQAQKKYEDIRTQKKQDLVSLNINLLSNENPAIRNRVIRCAINDVLGNLTDISSVHISDISDLIEKKSGKMLNLPQNLKVYTFSERLIFTTREINNEQITYRYKIEPEGYTFIDEIKMGVRTSIMDKKDSLNLPTSQFAKVFDYDKIKGDIILRNREAGDKYKPIGLKGTKKVKDILIEKKVLPQDKYKYPVLCDENGIMWLYDYRIDENYKIDENTKKVIRIQFKKDME